MNGESLSSDEKDFIRQYVEEAVTAEEKTARRTEMSAEFEVSLPTIRAITAWTKIRQKQTLQPVIEIYTGTGSLGESEPAIKEDAEEPEINYDNEEKIQARFAYRDFIASCFSRDQLRNAHALCFCATDWLDVRDIFDPLGIPRQNVTGAEFDERLQPKAEEKARELGTNFFAGDIKKLLEEARRKFSICIVDFKGQLSETSLDVLRKIHPSGVVIANFQRKRERKEIQMMLRENEAYKKMRIASKEKPLTEPQVYADIMGEAQQMATESDEALEQLMADHMFYEVFNDIGVANEDDWRCQEQARRVIELGRRFWGPKQTDANILRTALSMGQDILCGSLYNLLRRYHIPSVNAVWGSHNIAAFTQRTVLQKGLLVKHASHRYISPENKTPFISQMGYLELPESAYRECKDYAEFFLKAIYAVLEAKQKNEDLNCFAFGFEGIDKKTIMPSKHQLHNKTRLCFKKNGKYISVIHAGNFDAAIDSHVKFTNRCHLQQARKFDVLPEDK